jgi:putative colanic acid biosynthesis UDP-glucose lipid carrier transferase
MVMRPLNWGRVFVTNFQEVDRPLRGSRADSIDDMENDCVEAMPRDLNLESHAEQKRRLEAGARRLAASKLKRVLDIFGSTFGILILSPLFMIVAAAIMLESPGSALFRQRRTGYLGAPFVIYKFRSMRVQEDGANVVQARRDDDRITRLGLLLRRTSIDELPQLINVLKGEMSLVGPRPHALVHDEYYGRLVAGYDDRFKTKPGLTGLAQVSGLRGQTEAIGSMAARIEKDLEYIREWSFLLDIKILLRTVLIFAFHPAAY